MSLNEGIFEQVNTFRSTRVTETLWTDANVPISSSVSSRSFPEIPDDLTTTGQVLNEVQSIIDNIVRNSTANLDILQELTTKLTQTENNSLPEVIINGPEVTSDSGFGTAEKVVTGAVVIVVVLAIVALILRVLGPRLRTKSAQHEIDEQKLPVESISTKIG